jgi:predicted RNA binding protein YcfA (HicA-like mRNA interferase family)
MKIPRNLSAQDLIKALQKYQYIVDRQKGSHIRLTTSTNGQHHITIPNHDPLRIGTLSSILGDVADHLSKTKEEVVNELFG